MNGPDLTFLAERSQLLVDRTPERLAGIHDRIEETRRRRRGAAAIGAVGAVAAVVLGLVLVGGATDRTKPSPAPFPSRGLPPVTGTCWAVPGATAVAATGTDLPYDASPQVPCTQAHNTETVTTYYLDEPTPELAATVEEDCVMSVRNYLGIDSSAWIPWWTGMALPSQEQIAAGASWVRCDAVIPDELQIGTALRTVTRSVEGIADDPPVEFLACLSDPPTSWDDLTRVPCGEPHAYEQTGTLAVINAPETYPDAAERADAVRRSCTPAVPPSLAGASVTAVWDPRDEFERFVPVSGVCFMSDPAGSLLPALSDPVE